MNSIYRKIKTPSLCLKFSNKREYLAITLNMVQVHCTNHSYRSSACHVGTLYWSILFNPTQIAMPLLPARLLSLLCFLLAGASVAFAYVRFSEPAPVITPVLTDKTSDQFTFDRSPVCWALTQREAWRHRIFNCWESWLKPMAKGLRSLR